MVAMRHAVADRDRAELATALRAQSVPAGEVNTVRENLEDPHIQARGMVQHFTHPTAGAFPALRNPLRFEGLDDPVLGTPPLLGADTDTILRDELGYGAEEIARLREERVV
jgi:crotonobetainyl-CoA:carnitine CoA-transferase CaiB-like acyl-CoA transferase